MNGAFFFIPRVHAYLAKRRIFDSDDWWWASRRRRRLEAEHVGKVDL
jgi:hypothetical protein